MGIMGDSSSRIRPDQKHTACQRGAPEMSPHDPLHVVRRLFHEESIHGAPVVANDGKLCGIVSTFDLTGLLAQEA